jgi:hypothetical protein
LDIGLWHPNRRYRGRAADRDKTNDSFFSGREVEAFVLGNMVRTLDLDAGRESCCVQPEKPAGLVPHRLGSEARIVLQPHTAEGEMDRPREIAECDQDRAERWQAETVSAVMPKYEPISSAERSVWLLRGGSSTLRSRRMATVSPPLKQRNMSLVWTVSAISLIRWMPRPRMADRHDIGDAGAGRCLRSPAP